MGDKQPRPERTPTIRYRGIVGPTRYPRQHHLEDPLYRTTPLPDGEDAPVGTWWWAQRGGGIPRRVRFAGIYKCRRIIMCDD